MRPRLPFRYFSLLGLFSFALLGPDSSQAGSATWNATPANGGWSVATNWTPATVPSSTADTATFASSSMTSITGAVLNVGSIVFTPDASAYTITPINPYEMTMAGAGVINNSGILQNFVLPAVLQFANDEESVNSFTFGGSATAGTLVQYSVLGSTGADGKTDKAGLINFDDTSSAEAATFIVDSGSGAGTNRGNAGAMMFFNSSSAGDGTFITNGGAIANGRIASITFNDQAKAANATFTNNGATVEHGVGSFLFFGDETSAGNATSTNNAGSVAGASGAETFFYGNATAANATLIANGGAGEGGRIGFSSFSSGLPSGGSARIEVFGNGQLDISLCAPGVTIGSLEGDGLVFLGAHRLKIGSNRLSTIFSGVIQDGGNGGGVHGGLTKTGKGKLTLTAANLYTGLTTVIDGTLTVDNMRGSGTGFGSVSVATGTLAGGGTIAGSVSVGGPGVALVSPGGMQQATLTIQGSLTLGGSGTYLCTYRGNNSGAQADQLVAKGVTLNDGAGFNFRGAVHGNLPIGTVLTVINNTSARPIAGNFSNLADGAIFAANGGNFQANYEGGDGNDLTLTVVP